MSFFLLPKTYFSRSNWRTGTRNTNTGNTPAHATADSSDSTMIQAQKKTDNEESSEPQYENENFGQDSMMSKPHGDAQYDEEEAEESTAVTSVQGKNGAEDDDEPHEKHRRESSEWDVPERFVFVAFRVIFLALPWLPWTNHGQQ